MRNYCSVADHRYLPQLLAMYESLRKHSSCDITLHVLALDEAGANTLRTLNLPGIEVDVNIFRPKEGQTWREFCWSCASRYSDYLLNSLFSQAGMPDLTYVDSDVFWFADPENIFREMGERSIGITPHRLIPSKQHLIVNGKYNVGVVVFKNTEAGRDCLSKWAANVRNKCSATDGCGDQKYLDFWCRDYGNEVCELGIGVNVAPWNVANYNLVQDPDGTPLIGIPKDGYWNYTQVCCYHFHEYIHGERLTNYELRQEDILYIYAPYVQAVNAANVKLFQLRSEREWETA